MVRNKKEVLSKIGSILTDIREQHAYLSKNIAEVNELEMELLMANATFLVNHVAVLQRMTTMSEPSVKPAGATKKYEGVPQVSAGTAPVKEERKNTAVPISPKKREPEGLLATIKSTLASIAIPSDEALREEIPSKSTDSAPQVDHPLSPSIPEFAAKVKDIEPVSVALDQKPVSVSEVAVNLQNQENIPNEAPVANNLSTLTEPVIKTKRLEKFPDHSTEQSPASPPAELRLPVHESDLINTPRTASFLPNVKPEHEVNASNTNKPSVGNPIRKSVNKASIESTAQLPSYLPRAGHPEPVVPKSEVEKLPEQELSSENLAPATKKESTTDEKEEEVKIPNWKLGLRGSLVTSFDFEKKNVDELFDRPLTSAERQVINLKASKKEETLSEKESIQQPIPDEIAPISSPSKVERVFGLPDVLDSTKPTSINDRHKLGDQAKSTVSKELRAMISLNDKLLFTKDLFKSHGSAYSEAIDQISELNTFEEVDLFLQGHYAESYGWANKQRTLEKFYSILRKRFY